MPQFFLLLGIRFPLIVIAKNVQVLLSQAWSICHSIRGMI